MARPLHPSAFMPTKRKPPWQRPRPKSKRRATKLSTAAKQRAKARAKRAGRRYPNLVDNMREAGGAKKKRATS